MARGQFLEALNIKKRCSTVGVKLWQCPHFLFPVMGTVIITAIIATNVVARRFTEPEIAALIVLGVTALLFVVGNAIVRSFESIVEVSRLKSEFVRIVSHELRSPLSAIKWNLDLLKSERDRPSFPQDIVSMIESIGEQNTKMNRLVNILLEVRRVEDERIDLKPQSFSLEALTQEMIETLVPFARASNVEVKLSSTGALPHVFADPKRIRLVVEGLLDNAIRYSPERTEALVTIEKRHYTMVWRIQDNGIGISKEDQKKIFTRFFRTQGVYRYRRGGLGVSLFLSQAFVKASGGEIDFRSKEGEGSTFWFTLPLHRN